MNLSEIIDATAAADPVRPALILHDEPVNFGDLRTAVDRVAARLQEAGVQPGDRVAVVDVASITSIASLLGVAKVGGAAALLNPALKPAELQALTQLANLAPVAITGETAAAAMRGAVAGPVLGQRELIDADGPIWPTGSPAVAGTGECYLLFTSGTTGLPKPVPLGEAVISERIVSYAPGFSIDTPPRVGMMCVPLFHVGGSLGLLFALWGGNTTVIQPRFDAGEWLRLVETYGVTNVFLVPTMLQRILDHPDFATRDLSSLAAISYGAAAAPIDLVHRAMELLPHCGFANVFGQTETLGAYTMLGPEDHRDPKRVGSVGKALPGTELRVVDPETGQDLPANEIGELWVLSPQNVTPGWLQTGDLARIDEDGYVFPYGRGSETINRGGEKFGPLEIEAVLREHPAIRDCAVAGLADHEMGQRVGAAIVATETLTADDVKVFCRQRIAYFKAPERIVFVDDLPYSATGKVNRKQLAELITSQLSEQEG